MDSPSIHAGFERVDVFSACGYCLIVPARTAGTYYIYEPGCMYNHCDGGGKAYPASLSAFVTAETSEHDITFKILQNIPIREQFFVIDIVMNFTKITCHTRDEKIIKGRK